MRLNDILNEMPVASFDTVGELGQTSKESKDFNLGDWKVTHSPKAIAKIYRIFEKTPFWFNFIVVFTREADKSLMFDKTTTPEQLSAIVGKPVKIDGAITVVYNNHVTAESNRMPISAWTLAHRFGHAAHLNNGGHEADHPVAKLWYKIDLDLRAMMQDAYQRNDLRATHVKVEKGYHGRETFTGSVFCTFKAARDNNLNSNWEVVADLFAQYLISGRIRLNRLDQVTQRLNVDLGEMPDADYDKINAYVDAAEGHLNNCMEMVLKSLVGTIVGF